MNAMDPVFDLGEPGPHRDALVASVLGGAKTATSSLLVEWDEPLPTPGGRYALTDSTGRRGTVEITEVRLLRLRHVDDVIARAEGFDAVTDWRATHEEFWRTEGRRPGDDDVLVVELFHLLPRGAPAYTVRAATADDHDALVDLTIELHEWHRPLHPLQRPSERDEFSRVVADIRADPSSRVTVGVGADGAVLGHAVAVTVERERTHLIEASTVVEFDQLAVRPEARGTGIGRALATDVVGHARRAGASDVLLTVWAANPSARRLYESLGFAVRQHRMGLRL